VQAECYRHLLDLEVACAVLARSRQLVLEQPFYTVTPTGTNGCAEIPITSAITVAATNTVSVASYTQTLCIVTLL
jgi:hypothetical protein